MALTDNLAAYYAFNGNGSDSSGNGSHYNTLLGSYYIVGSVNNSFGSYVRLITNVSYSSSGLLGIGATGLSISAWIKYSFTTTGSYLIREVGASPVVFGILLNNVPGGTAGSLGWTCGSPQSTITSTGTVKINNGNWHHIVCTWGSGMGGSIWVDGVLSGTGVQAGGSLHNDPTGVTNYLFNSSTNKRYLGSADELAVWRRRLTDAEIAQLWNNGSGLAYPFITGPGFNMKINIGDVWKDVAGVQINIGDTWKTVSGAQINIGDVWKTS